MHKKTRGPLGPYLTIGSPGGTVDADFSTFDSARDLLRDAAKWGLLEEILHLLGHERRNDEGDTLRIARDIGYELAGAKDRDFAVDLFIQVTGIAEFGPSSLRDYAAKHGCSHEWFRQEMEAMRKRLNLPAAWTRSVTVLAGPPESYLRHAP